MSVCDSSYHVTFRVGRYSLDQNISQPIKITLKIILLKNADKKGKFYHFKFTTSMLDLILVIFLEN